MTFFAKILLLLAVACVGPALQGCVASTTVRYSQVEPGFTYGPAVHPEPRTFAVVDSRAGDDKAMHTGSFQVDLEGERDEIAWLGENLERVFQGQGLDLRRVSGDADLVLHVKRFRMRNRQPVAGGPYHTFTTFRGELLRGGKADPITAYYKGSYAVFSDDYSPVNRNCYQLPLEAVVLEIAAKINRATLGRRATAEEVRRLEAAIPGPYGLLTETSFLTVLRLGLTNNREVVPTLVTLTKRDQGWLRAAAVSALGTIHATEQFELLRGIYETDRNVAQLAALKSIGDLGTPEARAFLDQVRASPGFRREMIREIVALYD